MSLKVDALRAKYVAQRLEAIATLEVYTSNSVGIGEHPQIIEEMDKLVRTVADMNGYLDALDAIFKQTDSGTTVGETGQIND
mgnify:CR=1 FL=1|jgi:hypothetical protein